MFESRDAEAARERVGRILRPHRMDLLGPDPRLDVRVHSRRMRNIALTYLSYDCAVRLEVDELDSFFAVLVPVAGVAAVQSGGERVETGPDRICVLSPTEPVTIRVSADCGLLIVRIERCAMEARLSELIDGALREPIRFAPAMDVSRGYARSWFEQFDYAVRDLDRPESLLGHPLAAEQFEQNLITGLLLAQPHNYTTILNGDDRPVPSRLLGIAVDLIEGHPEWAHTPASLARQAGVSVRALQKAFREQLDTSPSEYLRGVRLQRVHDELCAAQYDSTTVGEIASKWGLAHHGRFAAVYRERFGESPKQTLSRQHARKG